MAPLQNSILLTFKINHIILLLQPFIINFQIISIKNIVTCSKRSYYYCAATIIVIIDTNSL